MKKQLFSHERETLRSLGGWRPETADEHQVRANFLRPAGKTVALGGLAVTSLVGAASVISGESPAVLPPLLRAYAEIDLPIAAAALAGARYHSWRAAQLAEPAPENFLEVIPEPLPASDAG